MKIIILILLTILCGNASVQAKVCTETEAIEAETSVLKLHTWEDIYNFFKNIVIVVMTEGFLRGIQT